MRTWIFLTFFFGFIGFHFAQAEAMELKDFRASRLLSYCNGDEMQKQVCNAYINGFLHGYGMANNEEMSKLEFCVPQGGVDILQVEMIFKKFAADHPDGLHLFAPSILQLSLNEAFPCRE